MVCSYYICFTVCSHWPVIGEWSIKSFIYLSSKHLLDVILHGHEPKTSMLKCNTALLSWEEGTTGGGGDGGLVRAPGERRRG